MKDGDKFHSHLEEALYERKICQRAFCFVLLDKIHSFYDGNGEFVR